jgi:hypothetical protein
MKCEEGCDRYATRYFKNEFFGPDYGIVRCEKHARTLVTMNSYSGVDYKYEEITKAEYLLRKVLES